MTFVLAAGVAGPASLSIAQPVLRLDGSGGFERKDAAAAVSVAARAAKVAESSAEPLAGALAGLAAALVEGGLAQATAGGIVGDDAERIALGMFIESRLAAVSEVESAGLVRPSTARAAAGRVRVILGEVETGFADAEGVRRGLRRALGPVAVEAGVADLRAEPLDALGDGLEEGGLGSLGIESEIAVRLVALGDGERLVADLAAVHSAGPAWLDAATRAATARAVTRAVERAERGDWSGFAALAVWARAARTWEGASGRFAAALAEHETGMKLWMEALAEGREPRWAIPLAELLADAAEPIIGEEEVLRTARPLWRYFAAELREARAGAVAEARRLYRDGVMLDPALVAAIARMRDARRDGALIAAVSRGLVDHERRGVMEARRGWSTPALALVEAGKVIARAEEGESADAAAAARDLLAACADALAIERVLEDARAPMSDAAREVARACLEAWVRSLRGGKELGASAERAALGRVAAAARFTESARWGDGGRAAWWAWPATDELEARAKRELTAAAVRAWGRVEQGDIAAAAREIERAERDLAPGLLAAAISRRLSGGGAVERGSVGGVEGSAGERALSELCALAEPGGVLCDESRRVARAGWMWLESRGPRPVTFGRLAREAADEVLARLER